MLLATTMSATCSLLLFDPPSTDAGVDLFDYDCNPLPSPSTPSSYAQSDDDSDDEDEEEHNIRVAPYWQAHRHLFESHGYHLDTCKDVRQFYLRYWETRNIQQSIQSCAGYKSACREDDNELCKDESLVSLPPLDTAALFPLVPLLADPHLACLLAAAPIRLIVRSIVHTCSYTPFWLTAVGS